jgi:hypothetical protein
MSSWARSLNWWLERERQTNSGHRVLAVGCYWRYRRAFAIIQVHVSFKLRSTASHVISIGDIIKLVVQNVRQLPSRMVRKSKVFS